MLERDCWGDKQKWDRERRGYCGVKKIKGHSIMKPPNMFRKGEKEENNRGVNLSKVHCAHLWDYQK